MKRTIILTAAIVAAITSLAQVPSDSVGVFAITEGKTVRLEPLNFAGTKTNVLGTALTYGIASTKIKHTYNGATSPVALSSPAKLRLRFGSVPPAKTMRYYMFSPQYTPRDFSVARFDVKKGKRILTGGKVNIWSGASMGVEQDEAVSISYDEAAENDYVLTVTAPPGEYCLFFSVNGTGVYNTVFDFTIK